MAAGARRRQLLRHHRGDTRRGDARSALRVARAVPALHRGAVRRHHAGAAAADRAAVPRRSGRAEIRTAARIVSPMDGILLLKLLVTPAIVLGASLAGRVWGQSIGGWLVALPLTSGPV